MPGHARIHGPPVSPPVPMPLRLYNSLSRQVEAFEPLDPACPTMYVCGPTVYNYVHIGNARGPVVFGVLAALLRRRHGALRYARNITDVDDKINAAAAEQGVPISAITGRFAAAYREDMAALGVVAPDIEPEVTTHMPQIVAMIAQLVDSGHAYAAEGHVLFSVASFPQYGQLSRRDPEEMLAGARVEVAPYKRDPGDFVLWKPSTGDLPGWDSPWGRGRPGWHIECSTMAKKHLGETIDIHGGGQDLQFPHHENEIAQSEACNGVPFAKYWMHNGYITVDGVKMSKSLNNFFTVRDIRKDFTGDFIRFFLLSGHYRSPINFSDTEMNSVKQGYDRIVTAVETLEFLKKNGTDEMSASEKETLEKLSGYYKEEFIAALEDDLNTALAISVIFEMVTAVNQAVHESGSKEFAEEALKRIHELTDVLGILQDAEEDVIGEDIQALVDERQQARKEKNWARADEIRDMLAEKGYTLKDTPQGVQIIRNN